MRFGLCLFHIIKTERHEVFETSIMPVWKTGSYPLCHMTRKVYLSNGAWSDRVSIMITRTLSSGETGLLLEWPAELVTIQSCPLFGWAHIHLCHRPLNYHSTGQPLASHPDWIPALALSAVYCKVWSLIHELNMGQALIKGTFYY